ncbi:MAG TPA: ComEC/Rec2 family competence protein, partial [Verrucomicrobiota bacterium]|nr:ComEC/Rec2 family competence protein [Verrucomicrobiota bacterium]
FIQTGTMHIFAISGMHIALLAGILVSLLRVVRVPRFWCGAVVIPLIWFYTGATGWQQSAVRSALMMTVVVGGWSLKRPGDLLNSLGAAAVAILLFDPHQLFQASFQLSFFVVLSIALLVPPLRRFVDRLLRFDPLLPAELVPRWKRLLVSPVRWLLMFTATSVAAWLGAWPLTALYFHMFSPVTLLANLAMVPLSSAALACSLGSLVFGAWCPPVSELFNHSAWFWMTLAMRGSEILAHIPGAFFYVPAPALVDFVLYYCVLIACLSGFAFAPRRRYWTAALLVGIGAFYFWRWNDARHGTVLTVLPVSGGSAVHCDAPGWRDDLLLDCGNTNSVKFVTLPFLRSRGVNCLASMALSHGDTKCVGGAIALLDEVPARQTAISPVRFRSAVYRRVAAELPKHADHHREIHRGEQLNRWSVLHPERTAKASQADDAALVLMGDHHGARVLLLSDLSRAGQNALIDSGQDLRADIVIAGLPEKSEPLCDALIERVGPRLIIIADSEFPATRRASPALRDRLARASIPVLYTRFAGAVTLELRANRIRATAMDGTRTEFARD